MLPAFDDTITLPDAPDLPGLRYFNVMVRDLDAPIPDFPMPPGLELRPVLPNHSRPIWEATKEAFRDHWGYSPWPNPDYERWRNDPATFQPKLWQVAWDSATDEIAGGGQTFIDTVENEKHGRRRGNTETIGVRRPYRRRGLARGLAIVS